METGLEGKPWYVGLGIGLVIGLVIFLAYHLHFADGVRNEIADKDARIAELQTKIQEGQNALRELPRFEAEAENLKRELDRLLLILPARKNTQDLIRRIRQLTEQQGFNMRVFDPAEKETDKDFYKEWPIKIDLDGGYHELAVFFDRIADFKRIINIDNLRISANRSADYTIAARFTAKTFVYKERPASDDAGGSVAAQRGAR